MDKILGVMEDIKQKITDNEYKIIMDSLMEIHKNKEDNEVISNLKRECNNLKLKNESLKRQLEHIKNSIDINNRSQYSISPLYL
jgi:FtsZ-binding cell division protein ZapB